MMAPPMNLSWLLVLVLLTVSGTQSNVFLSCKEPTCKQVEFDAFQPVEVSVSALPNEEDKLCVFCYPGRNRTWKNLWINPKVTIVPSEPGMAWHIYHGRNVSEVVTTSKARNLINWPSLSFATGQLSFHPFNKSCIGVLSTKPYTVNFRVTNPELFFVLQVAFGLLLFFFASSWSRNTFLHYGTGMTFGVLCSLLIVVFIIRRFMPQKLMAVLYTGVALSTTISMYLFSFFSDYLYDVVIHYWHVLVIYIVITGLVSFAIVYRYGPVTNSRSLDLIKWMLQGVGLLMVYWGTQMPEMSLAIILAALVLYWMPLEHVSVLGKLKQVRYRYFPPRTRLLTLEEYYTEGQVETRKALDGLREFCRSPDCNAWRTMSNLSSPNKFASFMVGESHVSDSEHLAYNTTAEVNPLDFGDDSSESELSFEVTRRQPVMDRAWENSWKEL